MLGLAITLSATVKWKGATLSERIQTQFEKVTGTLIQAENRAKEVKEDVKNSDLVDRVHTRLSSLKKDEPKKLKKSQDRISKSDQDQLKGLLKDINK